MRKIEQQMIAAVRDLLNNTSYDGVYWRSGNMLVEQKQRRIGEYKPGNNTYQRIISVRLHGNEIAAIRPAEGTVWVSDCGWQTATTKSRLWVILRAFTHCPYVLCQQGGEWVTLPPSFDRGGKRPWPGSDTLRLVTTPQPVLAA